MPCSIVECSKYMAGIEQRIVLIDPGGQTVEITPTTKPGAVGLLGSIRTAVAAGVESGLLESNPFVIPQAGAASTSPVIITREHTLALAISAYKEKLADPQRLYDYYQAHWDYYGIELMGLSQKDTRVADVTYKEDEIWQFMKLENPQTDNQGVELGYFHLPVLASSDTKTRILIGKGFSNLGASWVFQQGHEVINGHQISGWMRVDASLDAPYRINKKGELKGLNVEELKEAIVADNRVGQTINIYGPSGNVINQIFGYHLDQGSTWSRVPESLGDGRVLYARFEPVGDFYAHSRWRRRDRSPEMGGRSFLGA